MKKQLLAVFVISMLLGAGLVFAFSTLSLSKVDFSSNDPSLNKAAWLLTVVEDGNSQYAVGTFDNEAIKTADGRYAQQDLKIEIENTKNTCEYAFQNSYTPIYRLQVVHLPGAFGWYNTESKCKASYPGTFYVDDRTFAGYCFIRNEVGKVTPLSTPVTTVESNLKLTAAGETVTGKVSNIAQKSVTLGSRATATWNGNLVSGEQCPNPLDSGVVGVKDSNGFFITSKAAYDRYDPGQEDFFTCLAPVGVSTLPKFQECVDKYNAKTNAVLTKTSIAPFNNATLRTDASGAGKAVVSLPSLLQYPVITMRVDANWLGVFLPVTKPEIVKLESQDFTEGSPGNIRATIKNAGSVKGSIGVTLSCTGSIDRTGVLRTLSLEPGATGTVDLPISCEADGSASQGSCTVTAADISKPENKDTESVSAICKPIALCQPGVSQCVDNAVQTCNSEGTKWVDEQVCPSGCTLKDGDAACVTLESCNAASDCDDGDDATVDSCVGVVEKTCKHAPVPPKAPGPSIPMKLIGFGAALVVLAIITYFLATNGLVLPAVASGILTLACLVGVILGVFATFSLLSAWLITIAMVLLLVAIGLFEFAPEVSVLCIIVALILGIVGIMILYQCTNPGPFWTWIGVCS